MKKVLALMVVFVMLFGLTACGSGSASEQASDNPPDSATENTDGDITGGTAGNTPADVDDDGDDTVAADDSTMLEPYVIDYLMLTNSISNELPAVTAEIDKIIQPKFNATLNLQMITLGDWWTVVSTMLNAGEKADIMFTADWYQYTQSIANNYFTPLNDLIDQYATETKNQLGENYLKGSQVMGINYGVPNDKELAANGGFMWNKTLADKYNLTPDPSWKSYADWEPLLQIIKDNEPNVLPILTDGNLYHVNIINYIPCDIVWDGNNYTDPTLHFLWELDTYVNECRAARDMYLKGFIPKDAVASDNDYNNYHLQLGDFFLTTQPLKPGKGKSAELMSGLIDKSIVYDEFETYPLLVNTTHASGSMLAIPSTSEDPARAMMFINEMHVNPDVTNLLAWGVEGVTYDVVSENPIRVASREGNSWTGAVINWTLGNIYNIYLSDAEPDDKYELLRATKEGIPGHVALGYRLDTDPWRDTITAVNNSMENFSKNIRVGAVDTDEGVANIIAVADAAGFRSYFEAVKADFNNWLTTVE